MMVLNKIKKMICTMIMNKDLKIFIQHFKNFKQIKVE